MPKHPFLDSPIEFLKGVGPQRGEVLKKELNIFVFRDLLQYIPFRYVDRSKFHPIADVQDDGAYIQIKGRIVSMQTIGQKRAQRLVAQLRDDTGMIDLVWFKGLKWIMGSIKTGVEYTVFGKPSEFNGRFNFVHPEIEPAALRSEDPIGLTLQPFYSSTEKSKMRGLDSKGIMRMQRTLLQSLPQQLPETLPHKITQALNMV
ncbi:MAG: OB-fold nucleic acid binding domain-containing protein, partial [Bacteroidota bacterium]